MNNFEKYTASPEMLEKLMKEACAGAETPWDAAFGRFFCDNCCEFEDCPEVCPHEEYRGNPGWWLGLEAEHGDM